MTCKNSWWPYPNAFHNLCRLYLPVSTLLNISLIWHYNFYPVALDLDSLPALTALVHFLVSFTDSFSWVNMGVANCSLGVSPTWPRPIWTLRISARSEVQIFGDMCLCSSRVSEIFQIIEVLIRISFLILIHDVSNFS